MTHRIETTTYYAWLDGVFAGDCPGEPSFLDEPIRVLGLSGRVTGPLRRLKLQTVGDLVAHTKDELLQCRMFGPRILIEVWQKLGKHGLRLKH